MVPRSTYAIEDTSDSAGDNGFVGPNYGGQNYDVEFLGVKQQGSRIYLAMVSGLRPDNGFERFGPGDIRLVVNGVTYGIEVGGGVGGGAGGMLTGGMEGSTVQARRQRFHERAQRCGATARGRADHGLHLEEQHVDHGPDRARDARAVPGWHLRRHGGLRIHAQYRDHAAFHHRGVLRDRIVRSNRLDRDRVGPRLWQRRAVGNERCQCAPSRTCSRCLRSGSPGWSCAAAVWPRNAKSRKSLSLGCSPASRATSPHT